MNIEELGDESWELENDIRSKSKIIESDRVVEFIDKIILFIEDAKTKDVNKAYVLVRKWETILYREYNFFYKRKTSIKKEPE